MFHTPLCHTPSFTHNFHTHHLSHTTLSHTHTPFCLSHTIFHIQLCHTHTPYFFVTYHLSHTALSHTQLFTYNLFYFSIIHHILCLSFLPRPPYNICRSLLEEVDLWGLSGPFKRISTLFSLYFFKLVIF